MTTYRTNYSYLPYLGFPRPLYQYHQFYFVVCPYLLLCGLASTDNAILASSVWFSFLLPDPRDHWESIAPAEVSLSMTAFPSNPRVWHILQLSYISAGLNPIRNLGTHPMA
ncbi:Uncharacterized protein FWK35_00006820 [Aphis craccivora]|uniref:Uncharacterized protein n=1 Tax=Aphis craccivora TaxID=307492 RepID=A0A6G0ZJX2_APHCR|nr:Uncharacterized protein FWK35_00006820 [Aphis craccivora]